MTNLQEDEPNSAAESDAARAPLPAGDPRAWSVLVAGTCLEDTPWPGWGNSGWDAPTLRGQHS